MTPGPGRCENNFEKLVKTEENLRMLHHDFISCDTALVCVSYCNRSGQATNLRVA